VSGPLRLVLDQIESGTPTVAEMIRNTGLADGVVRAALDHLVRSGRVTSAELSIGCPSGGCGSCASALASGTPGCGRSAPESTRRPGLVSLTLTRRA
jgi:hypothetical protein